MAKGFELGPDEVRALRGALSRADFARKVGVTPLTVYRWELPDGAAESRRPRGAVAERLRRAAAGERVVHAEAARTQRAELSPRDASAILPAIDRILRADFLRADDDLMTLLVSGDLEPAGRAMAQGAHALGQMLWRSDARAGFATLQPALKEADAGTLPPDVEVLVRTAAALVFSSPDGRLFDVGRVNAQVARAEACATRDTSKDILFLARVGAASASLYAGIGGREAGRHARAALAELMESVTEPVTRLSADEMRTHFAMFSGGPSVSNRAARFEEIAARASELGVPTTETRALCFLAMRLADEVGAPERILEMARRARDVAARGRLGPGLHSIFVPKAEAEAYLRLARYADAERVLWEGIENAQAMAWSPVPLVMPLVRLFHLTGRRERVADLAEDLIRVGKGVPLALGEVLRGMLEVENGARAETLGRAEQMLEQTDPSPYLVEEVLVWDVAVRVAAGDVAEARLALRRAQRLLDKFPSVAQSALLRRHQALLACREGRLGEAVPLLESALATFTVANDLTEAAVTRRWLAEVKERLEEPGARELALASEKEHRDLGLDAWPQTIPFGTFDPAAPVSAAAPSRVAPRAEGLYVAVDRLGVRGASPEMIRRELVAVACDLFPSRGVMLEEIGPRGEARLVEERGDARAHPPDTWFEFGDGMGARLRLGVSALPDGAHEVLRLLTSVASLSLEVASLRGFGREADAPEPGDEAAEVPGLVAASAAMRRLRAEIARLAGSRATVILTGESGTGKEVVARAIHDLSTRARGPYVTFNCAAVPRELFEAQLFGYKRGAFTGALADTPGVIRAANGGTLFLDEIGELPLDVQAKLLRFLENREILPLGESRALEVDVRTIAATHQDLGKRVREGKFREDLYYRLQVVPLAIPPLRERPDDVVALARHFVRTLTPPGAEPPALSPDALARLTAHAWPGNVRELRNVIERALAFAPLPRVLTSSHLRLGEPTLRPPRAT